MRTRVPLIALVLALPFCVSAAETARTESAGLRFAVSSTWKRVPAPSDMRAAQYAIPRADGDDNDGELILFFFGEGQGGGVEDNLKRWYGQFTPSDGRSPEEAAVLTKRTVNGLKVTTVDLAGTYRPAAMPGAASSGPHPGYRMLGAIVEGKGGPWFWKAVGPEPTIAAAKSSFDALVLSLEAHR